MNASPSPIDLITIDEANAWIMAANSNATQNNFVLQTLITSLSIDFLRRTGRASQSGAIPTQSPFNQGVSYIESYTGNGNDEMQLRNFPILSVQQVTVLGQVLAESTGPTVAGWFISPDARFLGLRLSTFANGWNGYGWSGLGGQLRGSICRPGWPQITAGIQVQYTAGFAAVLSPGELQTIPLRPAAWQANTSYGAGAQIFDGTYVQTARIIPANTLVATAGSTTPTFSATIGAITADSATLAWENSGLPYIVTVNLLPWLSDVSVKYFSSGTALTPVSVAPAAGQYLVLGGGQYLFNSADAGSQILISYNSAGTPPDVKETMLRWVNLIYKRRGWEGIRSLAQAQGGSTTYTSWEVDPSFEQTFSYYRRRA